MAEITDNNTNGYIHWIRNYRFVFLFLLVCVCVCVFSSTFCGDSWHAIEPPIRTAHLATYVAEASTKNCGVMPEVVDVCRQVDKEVQIIWKYPDHSNLCPEFIESTDWVGMVHYTHNTCPRQTPCLLYCLEFCIFFFFYLLSNMFRYLWTLHMARIGTMCYHCLIANNCKWNKQSIL